MNDNSTPISLPKPDKSKKLVPKKSTLDFLKQFARSYEYHSGVSHNLGGLFLN